MLYQQLIFAVFATIALFSAVIVIIVSNPVRSVLALVVCFLATAGIWMLAYAEFLALVLVLVYVGAVMTLFLFVVMMLDIEKVSLRKQYLRYLPFGTAVAGLLVYLVWQMIEPLNFNVPQLQQAVVQIVDYGQVQALGAVLYTDYAYAVELAGVLLLVAIIAAITLAHRAPRNIKTQQPVQQMMIKRSERVRLVKMGSEQP